MTTLNLLRPAHGDIPVTLTRFPDGQPHVRLDPEALAGLDRSAPVRIVARLTSSDALLQVLLLKDVLDRLAFERVALCITYLLAARMDRVMTAGEPFSLKVVGGLLNGAGFRTVSVFDPHSDVATAVLDRSHAVSNTPLVRDALEHYFSRHPKGPFCLVSPDAGALKKVHAVAAALGIDAVLECIKERDVRTGRLTAFKTTADRLDGTTCVIVDDICDGGGTFAGTAALLRERGAAAVVLVVSHGIFSKGPVIEGIDAIYCTDSYQDAPGVTCFPVLPYLPA